MDGKILLVLTLAMTALASEFQPESCACPRLYTPLCASNGRTYNSLCEFKCHLSQLSEGSEIHIVRGGRCGGGI